MISAKAHYIFDGGPDNDKIVPYPKGFMMIAGNASQLGVPDPNLGKRLAHGFQCLDVNRGDTWLHE